MIKEVRSEVKKSPEKKKLNKKNLEKVPKWARTKDQLDEDIDAEVDDLLNFTNNLDFEDVINDIEVRAAIKSVKGRVEEIKKHEDDERRREKLDKIHMRESDAKAKNLNMEDDNNRSELRSN